MARFTITKRCALISKPKDCIFRTQSDTEVLLHLYAVKGAAMVDDLRGMFAFGIWDQEKNAVLLARDPYGIKPLYYADDGHTLRFASQVKALIAGGNVSRDPEPAGWVGFHIFGSVPEPFTIYREIRNLPAGSTVWVDSHGVSEPARYFRIADVYARAENDLRNAAGAGTSRTFANGPIRQCSPSHGGRCPRRRLSVSRIGFRCPAGLDARCRATGHSGRHACL